MTRWVLKCTRCGYEHTFNVGYDLTVMGGRLYLYCEKCRRNTEHVVLGYMDEETGEFVPFEKALQSKYKSL